MEAPSGYLEKTLQWVSLRISTADISVKELEPAFAFMLVWSVFEGKLFKDENRLSSEGLVALVKAGRCSVDEEQICKIYDVFAKRYFGPSRVANAFKNLRLEDSKKTKLFFSTDKINDKQFVKLVMQNPNATFREKFAAVLLVAHRFRNNLYHGIKRVDKLKEYQNLYLEINYLLELVVVGYPENWRESQTGVGAAPSNS